MTLGIKDFEPPSNLRPFSQTGQFILWGCWYVRVENKKRGPDISITNEAIVESPRAMRPKGR